MEHDDEPIEIRCLSAAVCYDGSIDVELVVPGYDEPVRQSFPGTDLTLLLNWSHAPRPIDLDGKSATDRRCREIVTRGIARLRFEMERQRAAECRRRLAEMHRTATPDE